MSKFQATLKEIEVIEERTLKERVREQLPDMEAARANKTPWRQIHRTLELIGISIDPGVLANYVCELRKQAKRKLAEPEKLLGTGDASAATKAGPIAPRNGSSEVGRDGLIKAPDIP
ncbi:hypothetical protein [Bosea sp. (in: a-proteobacteria)]|uniref:hypothetical protein n=1 Tax=Bosea sp. (in: a-proteobacteria) TaxID=1871050 RepID=UPI002735362E|nr:hypothetical protein [Bosea sp. (in: a-proteobacteria)]MDP3258663.1 hypothetical protein [Bosea sp. (in: a-proteobacteria)]